MSVNRPANESSRLAAASACSSSSVNSLAPIPFSVPSFPLSPATPMTGSPDIRFNSSHNNNSSNSSSLQANFNANYQTDDKFNSKSTKKSKSKSSSNSRAPADSPSLSLLSRHGFGVGHVLNDLSASCWFSYLLVFLRTVLLFPSPSAGLLLFIGQLADGLATPVVGLLSDSTVSHCGIGKRKLWILLGTLMVAASFPPIFGSPLTQFALSGPTQRLIYYAFFIVLFQFGWASVQVNHLALVPELTRSHSERVLLNSLRSVWTILSNLTVFALAWILLKDDTGSALGPTDEPQFFQLSLIVVVIGLFFTGLFLFCTPLPVPRVKMPGHSTVLWFNWFTQPAFYRTAVLYTCSRILVNLSQCYIALYLIVSLGAPKQAIATVPLTMFFGGLVATVCCERLTKRFGSEGLTLIGCVIGLVSLVSLYYLPAANWVLVYPICLILGVGCGAVGVSGLSLICALIGENCESGAFVYGAMSFLDKLSNGAAIVIAESFSPSLEEIQQNPELKDFYRTLLIRLPGAAALIAAVVLLSMNPFNRNKRKSIRCCDGENELNDSAASESEFEYEKIEQSEL